MFEAAELGKKISKSQYDAAEPKLRADLILAEEALKDSKSSVIMIFSGADAAGKGEMVQRLHEWLDPRGVETNAFWRATDEERERPRYWRFWRALPARGRIGIFFGSWYSEPIVRLVHGKGKTEDFDSQLQRIAFFENMLAADGAVILKFWFHLSKKAQKQRLKDLEKHPQTKNRVLPVDWKNYKLYDKFIEASERAIRHTDSGAAPWHIIDATDRRYRELAVGRILLKALRENAAATDKKKKLPPPPLVHETAPGMAANVLEKVDLTQKLEDREYKEQLDKYQGELTRLTWKAQKKGVSTVMAFEGWDAAGKGSAIRRVTEGIDPRLYRVVPIAAPTDEERAHHYLWRFWRRIPMAGFTSIFDRTWYGRVLVERVEGFARKDEWQRAYSEINDFEEQLSGNGIVVLKFWVHIGKDEQLRRFKSREETPAKRYKITGEDWRNRKKWGLYQEAVNDMVNHTSTEYARWTLVAGNDKKFARIQILKTVCEKLAGAVD